MKKDLQGDYIYDFDLSTEDDILNMDELLNNERKYKDELQDIFKRTENKTDNAYNEDESVKPLDEVATRLEMDHEAINTFIDNIESDTKLKRSYAYWLLGLLFIQLIAVNAIFILRGLKILNYSDVSFNIFISGALVEVIALVAIVVKYLFKDNITEALNNILEKNVKKG